MDQMEIGRIAFLNGFREKKYGLDPFSKLHLIRIAQRECFPSFTVSGPEVLVAQLVGPPGWLQGPFQLLQGISGHLIWSN